jgi:ribosomal-protein-alanine N-acetyltransferase
MIRRDMPEVLAIEAKSFEFPWSEDDFARVLKRANNKALVVQCDGRVVAYIVYAIERHGHYIQILTQAVDADYRRYYVGWWLVDKLRETCESLGIGQIIAKVRETNLAAQLFFKSCGFTATGTIQNDYEETDEDAIVFRYAIGDQT